MISLANIDHYNWLNIEEAKLNMTVDEPLTQEPTFHEE
jgi:hypothetical protein